MSRPAKDYKVLNCKIDKEVSEMLEKFNEKTGISKTAAVEKALRKYIVEYNETGILK